MRTVSGRIIIDELFSGELNNTRKIRVYLPPTYDFDKEKRFPVLYMHDGQNIFSQHENSWIDSWEVDVTAERLVAEGKISEIIIVGIDNNADRSSEYCHVAPLKYDAGRMGQKDQEFIKSAKGTAYEHFMINSVKPFIDKNYRTLSDRNNTALMGSSLGGLVTYFIGLRHPEVFGKLGLISPAFHRVDFNNLLPLPKQPLRIWMDVGEGEAHYVENSRRVLQNILSQGMVPEKEIAYYQVPGAIHDEKSWGERIHLPLIYFFGSIGNVSSCKLLGRKEFGLSGMMHRQINPVVYYDNELVMNDVGAIFKVDNEDILTVDSFGTVTPKRLGTTNVTYIKGNCNVTESYNIIEELSEMVHIHLKVVVPKETPENEKVYIYAGGFHELIKAKDGTFTFEITIPRDWGYPFTISKGNNHVVEACLQSNTYKTRTLYADKDLELTVQVDAWLKD